MERNNYFQIYRKTKFFEILEQILKNYVDKNIIPQEASDKVMCAFDKIIATRFNKEKSILNEHKWNITGYNANINNIDSLWNFTLKEPRLNFGTKSIQLDLLQVLCIDSELNPYVEMTKEEKQLRSTSMDVRKRKKN